MSVSDLRWLLFVLLLAAIAGCANKGAPRHTASPPPGHSGGGGYDAADSADYGSYGDGGGDAAGAVVSSSPSSSPHAEADEAPIVSERSTRRSPGLGTEFGEFRESHAFRSRFVRAGRRPETTLSLRYNDWEGVDAAASWHGSDRFSSVSSPSGELVVALVDEFGRPLPAVDVGSERYAVGQPGQRYQLAIENHTPQRWEIVASVDGLDIIDGRTAALHKRGYIVEPWSSVTIEGWRTSDSSIAAFRFGELPDSYAARKGQPRNIGVVGVAFFRERGARRHGGSDVHRRHTADPFPGRFASPPPPRRGW